MCGGAPNRRATGARRSAVIDRSARTLRSRVVHRLLNVSAMSWQTIKAEILRRHEHAMEHDDDEVRLILAFDNRRVSLVVKSNGDAAYAIAQIATGTASQIITMLRAATTLGVPLAMFGDSVCVRASIATDNVEHTLQATARAALRMRRATITAHTDVDAFAFAL